MGGAKAEEHLVLYAQEMGLQIPPASAELLVRHLQLVLDKNNELNLTAIRDLDSALVLHTIDSLTLLPTLERYGCKRFVDIGTGGGFPGIPLGVVGNPEGVLIDSIHKKAAVVQGFIEDLGLEQHLSARPIRAEELATKEPNSFDAVVARAVAPCAALVEYASPLLEMGGCLVLTKGEPSAEELSSGDLAAEICGMRRVSREAVELPNSMGKRVILVYVKESEPTIKLPRRAGMANKRPLA